MYQVFDTWKIIPMNLRNEKECNIPANCTNLNKKKKFSKKKKANWSSYRDAEKTNPT